MKNSSSINYEECARHIDRSGQGDVNPPGCLYKQGKRKLKPSRSYKNMAKRLRRVQKKWTKKKTNISALTVGECPSLVFDQQFSCDLPMFYLRMIMTS